MRRLPLAIAACFLVLAGCSSPAHEEASDTTSSTTTSRAPVPSTCTVEGRGIFPGLAATGQGAVPSGWTRNAISYPPPRINGSAVLDARLGHANYTADLLSWDVRLTPDAVPAEIDAEMQPDPRGNITLTAALPVEYGEAAQHRLLSEFLQNATGVDRDASDRLATSWMTSGQRFKTHEGEYFTKPDLAPEMIRYQTTVALVPAWGPNFDRLEKERGWTDVPVGGGYHTMENGDWGLRLYVSAWHMQGFVAQGQVDMTADRAGAHYTRLVLKHATPAWRGDAQDAFNATLSAWNVPLATLSRQEFTGDYGCGESNTMPAPTSH